MEKLFIGDIENIANESWIYLNDTLFEEKAYLRSVIVNDNIYVIGGFGRYKSTDLVSYKDEVEVIETGNNDNIYPITNINHLLGSVAAVFSPSDQRIYVMGML